MSEPVRRMHLGVSIIGVGSHPAAWRLRNKDAPAFWDVRHFIDVARIAERGSFDVVLLADVPEDVSPAKRPPLSGLEPTVLLASMAAATERIGFIGTVSTTFNEPYNLARRFASLDHVSGGRMSINAVTTYNTAFAGHFGLKELPDHATRYQRAGEFIEVLNKFWDSWEDGAVLADAEAGNFADMGKIHHIGHEGEFFSIQGMLPFPRSPQGRPVITQAGGSAEGRDLAARHAEIVYAAHVTLEDAQEYYRDVKERARRYGRAPGLPKILLGIAPVIGATTAAAKARKARMDALVDRSGDVAELAKRLGVAVADLPLDAPISEAAIATSQANREVSQGMAQAMIRLAAREKLTVRQLLDRKDKFLPVVGGPEDAADILEAWFRGEGADGYLLNVDMLPSGMEDFVDLVVPELRRRGLFREAYSGTTLRDHLGLARPASQYSAGSGELAAAE